MLSCRLVVDLPILPPVTSAEPTILTSRSLWNPRPGQAPGAGPARRMLRLLWHGLAIVVGLFLLWPAAGFSPTPGERASYNCEGNKFVWPAMLEFKPPRASVRPWLWARALLGQCCEHRGASIGAVVRQRRSRCRGRPAAGVVLPAARWRRGIGLPRMGGAARQRGGRAAGPAARTGTAPARARGARYAGGRRGGRLRTPGAELTGVRVPRPLPGRVAGVR